MEILLDATQVTICTILLHSPMSKAQLHTTWLPDRLDGSQTSTEEASKSPKVVRCEIEIDGANWWVAMN